MEEDEEKPAHPDLQEWREYSYTRRLAKRYKEDVHESLARLLGQCAVSPDPQVRALHSAYREKRAVAVLVGAIKEGDYDV